MPKRTTAWRSIRGRSVGRVGSEGGAAGESRSIGYLYLAPAAIVYGTFVLLPLSRGVYLSFFQWDGISPPEWAGLSNYGEIFKIPELRSAFVHSFILVIFYSIIPIITGLFIASLIARSAVRGLPVFRAVLFLPQILPGVTIGVIWGWVYATDGALNSGLGAVGLDSLEHGWLGDFNLALPAIGIVGSWVTFGFCMILFVAGIQKIPTSLYDAAQIDGAGPMREFFAVTVPGLRNEITVAAVITVIGALRTFDLVYILTGGGPGTSTVVPSYSIYNTAFVAGEFGTAAAMGVALSVLVIAVAVGLMRIEGRRS